MKMRIGICDDEKEIRDLLAVKIKDMYPEANLCFYEDGRELLSEEEKPDILFLDIQMPGTNGIETARRLRSRNENIVLIFVTALEDYVYQAFDVEAFHYLIKPFTDEKFKEVTERAVKHCQKLNIFLQEKDPAQKEDCLLIKSGSAHVRIRCAEIVYAEVFNRKIAVHTLHEDVEYYGKMAELETRLGEDFFRTHRSYLVHFKYVLKYNAATVFLEKGTALMAKKNYPEFVKRYLKYNRREGKR